MSHYSAVLLCLSPSLLFLLDNVPLAIVAQDRDAIIGALSAICYVAINAHAGGASRFSMGDGGCYSGHTAYPPAEPEAFRPPHPATPQTADVAQPSQHSCVQFGCAPSDPSVCQPAPLVASARALAAIAGDWQRSVAPSAAEVAATSTLSGAKRQRTSEPLRKGPP